MREPMNIERKARAQRIIAKLAAISALVVGVNVAGIAAPAAHATSDHGPKRYTVTKQIDPKRYDVR
jgi:hypothetical protein